MSKNEIVSVDSLAVDKAVKKAIREVKALNDAIPLMKVLSGKNKYFSKVDLDDYLKASTGFSNPRAIADLNNNKAEYDSLQAFYELNIDTDAYDIIDDVYNLKQDLKEVLTLQYTIRLTDEQQEVYEYVQEGLKHLNKFRGAKKMFGIAGFDELSIDARSFVVVCNNVDALGGMKLKR